MSNPDSRARSFLAPRRPLRVAMLTYSFYESDNRVRRYAETIVKNGHLVDVFSLRNKGMGGDDEINGVRIFRIQERIRNEKGKFAYLFRNIKFLLLSAFFVSCRHFRYHYDLIHVHSVPDFEVFAALIPKVMGTKVILDIHDPVPDFFMAKFGYDKNSLYFKMLASLERYSSRFADLVITVSDYWREIIKNRSGIPGEKITTIVNYADIEMFNPKKLKSGKEANGWFTILYPGTLNKHCGLHIVLEAMALLQPGISNIRLHIYGRGSEETYLRSFTKKLGLDGSVLFHEGVPIDQVPDLMGKADMGIALLSGEDAYSKQALNVKLFEFLAMGLPAVATRVPSIEKYVGEKVALLSEPNDPEDVARCIKELYENMGRREALSNAGLIFTQKNNWQSQGEIYLRRINEILKEKTAICG